MLVLMSSKNKSYKLTCLVSPLFDAKEIGGVIEKIEKWIKKEDGKIIERVKTEEVVRKRLSYPIKKNWEAFYATFIFSLAQDKIKDLQEWLDNSEDIIRTMITIKKKEKPRSSKKILKEGLESKIIDKIEPLLDLEKEQLEVKEPEPEKKKKPAKKAKVSLDELEKS